MEKDLQENTVTIAGVLPLQILNMLISISSKLVDSIIIGGYLKDEALAAYGLTLPVTLLVAAIGGMIGNGVQVLASESAGAGDRKKLNQIFSTSLTGGLVVAGVFALIILVFSRPVAVILGAKTESLVFLTSQYLIGYAFCMPIVAAQLIVPNFMQIDNGRKYLKHGIFLLIFSNVVLDFANVYIFHLGMFGMAFTTAISYYLCFGYVFFSFFKKNGYRLKLSFISLKMFGSILYIGLLYLVYKLCTTLMSLILNYILSTRGGVDYLAANSIIMSIYLILGAFSSGFGSTTTIFCSYHNEIRNEKSYKDALLTLVRLSILVNGVLILAIVLATPFLVGIFHPESEAIRDIAVFGLRLFAFSQIFSTINYIFKNNQLSLRNMKSAYTIGILNDLIFPLLSAMVLLPFLSFRFVWLCYTIGQMAVTLLVVCRLWYMRHKAAL